MIVTRETMPQAFATLMGAKQPIAFDFETSGVKLETAKAVGCAIVTNKHAFYFPLGHTQELALKRQDTGYEEALREYTEERARGVKPRDRKHPRKPTRGRVVPLKDRLANLPQHPANLPARAFWVWFHALFARTKVRWGAHNLPFDWRAARVFARRVGVALPHWRANFFDSLIEAYALSLHLAKQWGSLRLNDVAKEVLHDKKDEEALAAWFAERGLRNKIKEHLACGPIPLVGAYAIHDARLVLRLDAALWPQLLSDEGCRRLYEHEMSLVPTTIAMESHPKYIDLAYARDRFDVGHKRWLELKAESDRLNRCDTAKDRQLAASLLARGHRLPYTDKTAEALEAGEEPRGGIQYSVDAAALEPLRGKPYVDAVFRERALDKRIHTDLHGILEYTIPSRSDPALGFLFPNLSQTTARTGRYGSSKPNGQNNTRDDENDEWAKAFSVRRAWRVPPSRGRCELCQTGCAVCNGTGEGKRLIISADLKQIEPRLTAHMTRDPALIRVYVEDRDIYADLGRRAFQLSPDLDDKAWKARHPDERQAAKSLFLAILYGAGAGKVRYMVMDSVMGAINDRIRAIDRLPKTEPLQEERAALVNRRRSFFFDDDKAAEAISRIRNDFPNIDEYKMYLEEQYRANGFIRNPFGRKLFMAYEDAYYSLLNARVQSTAADLLKEATIRCAATLRGVDCVPIFSIHDELIFECRAAHAERALPIIRKAMTGFDLRVPLDVDISVTGTNWASGAAIKDVIPWEEVYG